MTSLNEINELTLKIYRHKYKRYTPFCAKFIEGLPILELCEQCGCLENHPIHNIEEES